MAVNQDSPRPIWGVVLRAFEVAPIVLGGAMLKYRAEVRLDDQGRAVTAMCGRRPIAGKRVCIEERDDAPAVIVAVTS